MIAVDTNILVYAKRRETPHHDEAKEILRRLAEGDRHWALPWPCIHEFLRVVTHPRVFDPPTRVEEVLEDLRSLLESPTLSLLGEGPAHADHMRELVNASRVSGNLIHDAHIVAVCVGHGVREIITADRDFTRFPGIKVRDPFGTTRGR